MDARVDELVGNVLGRYRIESKLGEGGMGIVYKAFDTHLLRSVALKILRSSFLADTRHVQRFLLEARAASALNHTNICTVYDAGEYQGICYIVLEYLQGETFRSFMKRHMALPLHQVLRLGIDLCDALSAAHQKGIIHRDIKPENIILNGDGTVKIMDFGLAKLKYDETDVVVSASNGPDDHLPTSFNTSQSSFIGTAAYMSPEQIKKKSVDERTDLFSLGMVLYEMFSGQHPFHGQDAITVMKAIVHDPPKPMKIKNAYVLLPVLQKAMAKNPEQRYAGAADMKKAMQKAQNHFLKKNTTKRQSSTLFLTLIFLLSITYWIAQHSPPVDPPAPPSLPRLIPIGQTMETEEWPSFSPDGRAVVYSSKRSKVFEIHDLCIKNIQTQRRKIVATSGNDMVGADWSPDGQSLAYTSFGLGIFVIDTAGIHRRQVASFGYLPRWSPDGKYLAFSTNHPLLIGDENAILRCSIEAGQIDRISPDNGLKYAYPDWSPDGRWIIATGGEGSVWDLWLIQVAARKATQLTHKELWIKNPVWSRTGSYIYFISNQNGFNEVWRQRLNLDRQTLVGEPVQMTSGADIDELDVSAIDNQLLLTRADDETEVWRVHLSGEIARPIRQAAKLMAIKGTVGNMVLSPDQDKLALEILEKGTRYILVRSLTDSSETSLHGHWNMFAPTWSADGQWLAFDAGGGNRADIYRMSVQGGPAEKIIASESADWLPSFSPIDQRLCFLSNRTGSFQIWLSDPEKQETIRLTNSSEMKTRASWSHDGKKLAFLENQNRASGNGSWVCVYDMTLRRYAKIKFLPRQHPAMPISIVWKCDDSALYYFSQNEVGVLDELNLADSASKTYRFVDAGYPFFQTTFDLHKDIGYFILANSQKDIWITEGPP